MPESERLRNERGGCDSYQARPTKGHPNFSGCGRDASEPDKWCFWGIRVEGAFERLEKRFLEWFEPLDFKPNFGGAVVVWPTVEGEEGRGRG